MRGDEVRKKNHSENNGRALKRERIRKEGRLRKDETAGLRMSRILRSSRRKGGEEEGRETRWRKEKMEGGRKRRKKEKEGG